MPEQMSADLRGRTVRVVGKVVLRDGRPGIEVDRPEPFRVLPG